MRSLLPLVVVGALGATAAAQGRADADRAPLGAWTPVPELPGMGRAVDTAAVAARPMPGDRKSTRLNSSHGYISYAVFCLKKKTKTTYSPPARGRSSSSTASALD